MHMKMSVPGEIPGTDFFFSSAAVLQQFHGVACVIGDVLPPAGDNGGVAGIRIAANCKQMETVVETLAAEELQGKQGSAHTGVSHGPGGGDANHFRGNVGVKILPRTPCITSASLHPRKPVMYMVIP